MIEVGPRERVVEERGERLRAGDAQAQMYPADKFGKVFGGGYVAINGLIVSESKLFFFEQ